MPTRATAEKVGQGICPDVGCGAPVMYRRSAGGMLSHRCDICDSSGFAPPGSDAYRRRLATVAKPAGQGAAAAKPAPAPDPAPAQPKRKRKGGAFALEGL